LVDLGRKPADESRRWFHGRRRGRPLSGRRKSLLATLLPKLGIVPPLDGVLDPPSLFDEPVDSVWLEIGFGGGEHLATQASAQSRIGFIGAEVFLNGIAALLDRIDLAGLRNIRIYDDDARLLVPCLAPASIGRCFILFPDPWPKDRHKRRRLIAPPFVDDLARCLADGAELRLASDDAEYVETMLGAVGRHPAFRPMRTDPRETVERPADWPETRYERKARAKGDAPRFLIFERRSRGAA
jgi:tRNA (guanine-N7-)-methyltransferase